MNTPQASKVQVQVPGRLQLIFATSRRSVVKPPTAHLHQSHSLHVSVKVSVARIENRGSIRQISLVQRDCSTLFVAMGLLIIESERQVPKKTLSVSGDMRIRIKHNESNPPTLASSWVAR
jgi:hypothetical protein